LSRGWGSEVRPPQCWLPMTLEVVLASLVGLLLSSGIAGGVLYLVRSLLGFGRRSGLAEEVDRLREEVAFLKISVESRGEAAANLPRPEAVDDED